MAPPMMKRNRCGNAKWPQKASATSDFASLHTLLTGVNPWLNGSSAEGREYCLSLCVVWGGKGSTDLIPPPPFLYWLPKRIVFPFATERRNSIARLNRAEEEETEENNSPSSLPPSQLEIWTNGGKKSHSISGRDLPIIKKNKFNVFVFPNTFQNEFRNCFSNNLVNVILFRESGGFRLLWPSTLCWATKNKSQFNVLLMVFQSCVLPPLRGKKTRAISQSSFLSFPCWLHGELK